MAVDKPGRPAARNSLTFIELSIYDRRHSSEDPIGGGTAWRTRPSSRSPRRSTGGRLSGPRAAAPAAEAPRAGRRPTRSRRTSTPTARRRGVPRRRSSPRSPAAIRKSVELWIGCVAGALGEREYREKLAKAGFEAIDVEPTRIYRAEDAREFLAGAGLDTDAIAPEVDGKFMSAFVRAQKPTR